VSFYLSHPFGMPNSLNMVASGPMATGTRRPSVSKKRIWRSTVVCSPLQRKDRPRCGARTRKGSPCLVRTAQRRRCANWRSNNMKRTGALVG
jgi:hypothetical protein